MLFAFVIAARVFIIFSLQIYGNGSFLISDLEKCMSKKKKIKLLVWLIVILLQLMRIFVAKSLRHRYLY